eukprot:g4521.t1
MNKNKIMTIGLALALAGPGLAWSESLSEQDLQDLAAARSALERGNADQALELLDPLYEQYPRHDEVTNNYAVALFNSGQAPEAGMVLQTYLQSHAEVGTASNNLFRVYDFLAAESYGMLSGSQPERPKLSIASSGSIDSVTEEAPLQLRDGTRSSETLTAEIERRMQGYVAAWSAGDAEAYLSYYIPGRSPVRGQGFERWQQERQNKIFPERNISVSVNELQIMSVDDSQAIAVYRQNYRASNYTKPSASPEEPEGSSVIRLDTSPGESPETAEPNEDNIAKLTPFYDEIVADGESPEQVTLEEDLDSELDQELKLISIFEENLASETAIREQIKEEEALISEAMPSGEDDDILDFDVDSLEPEASLEFVLEEPQPEIDAEENIAGLDELMDWAPAEKEDVSAQQNRIAEKPDTPANTNAGSFTGYAESAGFNQINPVEVIDIVNSKLQAAKSADQESTLFYIELDKFETLEKELGVIKIEKLAANVASNIYDRIENPITLRRFRQQGFVLLLSGGQNQQNLQFGQELASAMASTPIEVSGETFFVTLSIGIVPVASGFSDSAEIIEMAQSTVAKVREHNEGNGAELCEIDPDTAYNEASIMRTGRKLLNDSAFVTVYQPVTALKGDPLEFYEARLKIADHIETKNLPDDLIERLGNTDLSTEIDCLNLSMKAKQIKMLRSNDPA